MKYVFEKFLFNYFQNLGISITAEETNRNFIISEFPSYLISRLETAYLNEEDIKYEIKKITEELIKFIEDNKPIFDSSISFKNTIIPYFLLEYFNSDSCHGNIFIHEG
jgi:hypothetical protein